MIIPLQTANEIREFLIENGLTEVEILTPNHRDDETPYAIGFALNGKYICISVIGNDSDQWLNVDIEI